MAKHDVTDVESAVKACYSTWADSYFRDYYTGGAYPPVHLDVVRDLLRKARTKTLLDAGCGPASMLRGLADMGLEIYGFDLTPEMVEAARNAVREFGVAPERIWQGSVTDRQAFRQPGTAGPFDATICIGVFPHIPESVEDEVIANLRDSVRKGGLVAVEARNQLFGLFTLNRHSYDLFASELIRAEQLRGAAASTVVDAMLDELRKQFRMDLPSVRSGKSGEPGYDQVLARLHNPLTLQKRFSQAGFAEVQVHFYHYHCLPPMLEPMAPELFRSASLAMENPSDWRGYFMASAFIVTGLRA
jgi:2-polyprenyl-3-methyl-5-hydroxy-6-metoxy-1,4-benzoquinol methylase